MTNDYILLMYDDGSPTRNHDWASYLARLRESGVLEGGSAIGDGACFRKGTAPAPASARLTGYIRITADSMEQARSHLTGNPHYEAGGAVEIRRLPRDG